MTNNTKSLVKIILVTLISLILLVLPGVTKNADRSIENVYNLIAGEKIPDTNIVIIHISESDLERIGP
ncbi:MAG: hypothetical protein P8X73_09195, partial [Ignavibacteriaceae bacterium]